MSVARTDSDSDQDEQTVSRAAPGKNKHRMIENQSKDTSASDTVSNNVESLNAEKLRDIVRSELQALSIGAKNSVSRPNNQPTQFHSKAFEQQNYRSYNNRNQNNRQQYQRRPQRGSCYLCGEFTHYKANCPLNKAQPQQSQTVDNNGSSSSNDTNQGLNGNGLAQQP